MDNVFESSLPTSGTFSPTTSTERHLKALRIQPGAAVCVLNGMGGKAICRLQQSGQLQVEQFESVPKPPALCVALGHIDHRDRMEFAVEKVAELGCTSFIPPQTDHTSFERSNHERMTAKAQAALTQSGQAWQMDIRQTTTLDQLLGTLANTVVIVGDASGNPPRRVLGAPYDSALIIVGPEGGLSKREFELLEQAASDDLTISYWAVNKARLRAETAAVALVSTFLALHP